MGRECIPLLRVSLPYDIDEKSLLCCSQVLLHTSFISLRGASRPVMSSNASLAISARVSRPSTTTQEGDTVSLKTCICATSGVMSGS